MDEVCKSSKADLIGFFDIDCVPLNREKIFECVKFASKNDSFIGIAQVSNHIPPANHIYVAPAFFIISKKCWHNLDRSFKAYRIDTLNELIIKYGRGGDVAEGLSYQADLLKVPYRVLLPTHVYKPKWKLSCIAQYGIGTIFDNVVYHLYESRFDENVDLFEKHCQNIIDDELNLNEFQDARKL
jgi:hypothetical protein